MPFENRITSANDSVWESLALQWAAERVAFRVAHINAQHFPFCEKLCCDLGYKMALRAESSDVMLLFWPTDRVGDTRPVRRLPT